MRASTGPVIWQLIRHHGGWDGNPTAFPVCLPANRKQEGGTNWAIEERKTIIAQKGRQSAGETFSWTREISVSWGKEPLEKIKVDGNCWETQSQEKQNIPEGLKRAEIGNDLWEGITSLSKARSVEIRHQRSVIPWITGGWGTCLYPIYPLFSQGIRRWGYHWESLLNNIYVSSTSNGFKTAWDPFFASLLVQLIWPSIYLATKQTKYFNHS